MIYFIADLHFDDVNILNFENRPFSSVKKMNETIIANWNAKISDLDKVYLLGDIGNDEYISQLNGEKYLIKGNHDIHDNDYYRNCGFEEVYDMPVIFNDFWILSHEPLYVNENMPYANIYGHVHANPNYNSVSSRGFCACVERINYSPISFEEIVKKVQEIT